MAHVHILELDFLVDEVSGPQSDAIVVDGDELGVRVVEELNLVGGVSTNGVSTEGLSCCDLFKNGFKLML